MKFSTEQEAFWAGEFGSQYTSRNDSSAVLGSNLSLFARALRRAGAIESCIEFGANVGLNLRALKVLFPHMTQMGVEINADAAHTLAAQIGAANVFHCSLADYVPVVKADLSLVKGVLIHINPEMLAATYRMLYEASSRWLLICEYYNPSPVAVQYRGHQGRLFKRDFAGDVLDTFPDLHLVDYGFVYRRDPVFPQDDVTWFLLEKLSRP